MFSLICVGINGWVNNREAGDLRRYHAHYDVTVMGRHVVMFHVLGSIDYRSHMLICDADIWLAVERKNGMFCGIGDRLAGFHHWNLGDVTVGCHQWGQSWYHDKSWFSGIADDLWHDVPRNITNGSCLSFVNGLKYPQPAWLPRRHRGKNTVKSSHHSFRSYFTHSGAITSHVKLCQWSSARQYW